MINARSETADRERRLQALLGAADRRALLLADGFYEWLRSEDPKQPRVPFRFTLADGAPFAFAGLWTPGTLDGEPIESATILTTAANPLVAPVHDRMPVILPGPRQRARLALAGARRRRGEGAVRAAPGGADGRRRPPTRSSTRRAATRGRSSAASRPGADGRLAPRRARCARASAVTAAQLAPSG